ncbi:MAG: hypothetical protein KIS73_11920 [Enhydrobacter sp.]|nr:hypothetical protein [Enhydrobacter sp.]
MTIRSIKWAAGISVLAATLAFAGSLPAAAQGPVQAVPRAGVSFANNVTVKGWIESIDVETRTMVFTTPEGRLVNVAVGDSVKNLEAIPENTEADITYNEIVTLLNLRQKGPGSREARRDASKPESATDVELGRVTFTVTAVDLAANKVSVIDGRGGPIRTYTARSIATQDMLKKIKVGDVVIGLTTPMSVTAITPVR